MNARFAEPCKAEPLTLARTEDDVRLESERDGRTQRDQLLTCQRDIYIGVFFDGTNNNKYRDTASFSQSNVARLYEVYPGSPAKQTEPVLAPRVLAGGRVPRTVFPDQAFAPASVATD